MFVYRSALLRTGYNPGAMRVTMPNEVRAGRRLWQAVHPSFGIAFVGAGLDGTRREVLSETVGMDLPVAWLRQVHGAELLAGRQGCVGEADALTTTRSGLALAISTADCVPVLLATPGRVSAIHAGWRGIVAGVVSTAIDSFSEAPRAWIGPAIGPCCYEVGDEVADSVARACGSPVVIARDPGSKPHLDLVRAVELQLQRRGVEVIAEGGDCTRCSTGLHSFRRDGSGGRNYAFAWLR